MPNWVYNKITIPVKDKLEASKIKETLSTQEDEFSFSSLIPMPESEAENWYDWQISNWGTKWDASNVEIKEEENNLLIHFSTPWTVPLEFLRVLSQTLKDKELTTFYEEEQGFGAIFSWEKGVANVIKEWDIPESHKEMEEREEGSCYCFSYDEKAFPDCFFERAKKEENISPKALEVIKGLSAEWQSDFEGLLETAKIL